MAPPRMLRPAEEAGVGVRAAVVAPRRIPLVRAGGAERKAAPDRAGEEETGAALAARAERAA